MWTIMPDATTSIPGAVAASGVTGGALGVVWFALSIVRDAVRSRKNDGENPSVLTHPEREALFGIRMHTTRCDEWHNTKDDGRPMAWVPTETIRQVAATREDSRAIAKCLDTHTKLLTEIRDALRSHKE